MSRRTSRQIADTIISEGTILKVSNNTLIVSAFGHKYKIENEQSSVPKITQIDEVTNEQK